MATNPYVNKVIYGNQTVMDISGDTVTASDVAQGKTFHDATGEQKTGSYVAPVINDVTPSNLSPVSVNANENYRPTSDGILIKSQREIPIAGAVVSTFAAGNTLRTISRVHVITDYTEIIPSNASPVALNVPNFYKVKANSNNGYAIESYDSVTPSSTPTSVSSGDIVKIGGSGVIVDSIPTPTSITPSNASPVALTADTAVNPTTSGYAIESYSSKTPDDTTPPQVSAGDIVKITTNGGYLYETQQPTPTSVTPSDSNPPQLTANTAYSPTDNGYLYETVQTPGVSLNPSEVTAVCVRNTTSTVTIDTTKHYIVSATMRITGAAVRGGTWYVNQGVVSALTVTSDASANVTCSGTTLTLQGTQASYNIEFHVVRLD